MKNIISNSIHKTMKAVHSGILLSSLAGAGLGVSPVNAASFGEDVSFLRKHTEVVVLSDKSGESLVALVPAYQGRVMTSTDSGDKGLSFGWINRELIASGESKKHINVFGGEDRFWLGPEGGQFSIFFKKGVTFEFDNWFTPAAIDTDPFKMTTQTKNSASFESEFSLVNYSGAEFNIKVNRDVRLLTSKEVWKKINMPALPSVKTVAFDTVNKITNTGKQPWTKQTGLLSIWILGMFNPSPETTIVVPLNQGPDEQLGKKVTSDYFGQVPPERLTIKDDIIYFKADGKFRSKIGVSPKRSKGILGSYDAANKVLTIARFSQPAGVTEYVNSLWKLQDNPFAGDAANSYNDGPVAPGEKPLGPFYELESSSPAAALKPGKNAKHTHTTMHFSGSEEDLNLIARVALGTTLQNIVNALPK